MAECGSEVVFELRVDRTGRTGKESKPIPGGATTGRYPTTPRMAARKLRRSARQNPSERANPKLRASQIGARRRPRRTARQGLRILNSAHTPTSRVRTARALSEQHLRSMRLLVPSVQ